MNDWRRKDVLRALMTLQEEGLIQYEVAARFVDAYDEKRAGLDALQIALDFEKSDEPVSLHEAMGQLQSGLPDALADRINGQAD